MPKYIDEPVGIITRRRKVKTFGDHVKEILQGMAAVIFVLVIIGAVFG